MPKKDRLALTRSLLNGYRQVLSEESIPETLALLANLGALYLPLAHWINQLYKDNPIVIGINGAQGSGKSTLAKLLMHILQEGFGRRVVSLSIDDLYLTQAERTQLAEKIHPLLQTRGAPGTHDIELGIEIISNLKAGSVDPVSIPVFDKATDDRAPESTWLTINGPVDIILFEGWCVGSVPVNDEQLIQPLNELERKQDPDAVWRRYVNQQLATDYHALFELIDKLIVLEVPSFEKVVEWRTLQEQKLRLNHPDNELNIMTDEQIRGFIMFYERITRDNLARLPDMADITLKINDEHQVYEVLRRRTQA